VKYSFIRQARKAYPVSLLCKAMGVCRNGYYTYLNNMLKGKLPEQIKLEADTRNLFYGKKSVYGSRRLLRELQTLGYTIGRYKVRSLMRCLKLVAKRPKSYRVTTDSKHNYPVAPNLLNREFTVSEPNRVWVSDITYLRTGAGWMYLAVILDLFSRMVVGWSMSGQITADLVINALRMAYFRRKPKAGLLFHSDQGSQYASGDFQAELNKYNMICSMSRKGNCWDNAVPESFFGTLKTECTNSQRYVTRNECNMDVLDYIEMFYNSNRLHSTLGYLSPADFEAQYLKQKNQVGLISVSIFS